MKVSIARVLSDLQKKCMGYVVNMSYLYGNICVKADPMSLLGFEIVSGGSVLKIENAVDAIVHNEPDDDDKIDLYPKAGVDIEEIAAGVFSVHPEFIQSREQTEVPEDEKEYKDPMEYLRLTMPEVNEDRRDVLRDGVDTVFKACKAQLDALFVYTTGRLTVLSVGEPIDEVEETKETIEANRKKYLEMAQEITDEKKQQIEDAYQRYLKRKAEKGGSTDTVAGGSAPGQSLRMD